MTFTPVLTTLLPTLLLQASQVGDSMCFVTLGGLELMRSAEGYASPSLPPVPPPPLPSVPRLAPLALRTRTHTRARGWLKHGLSPTHAPTHWTLQCVCVEPCGAVCPHHVPRNCLTTSHATAGNTSRQHEAVLVRACAATRVFGNGWCHQGLEGAGPGRMGL